MADPEMDEDLFADLYDGEDEEPSQPVKVEPKQEALTPEPALATEEPKQEEQLYSPEPDEDVNFKTEVNASSEGMQGMQVTKQEHDDEYDRPIGIKEDGKMFIGGLNWETTDQSLKEYFSQFGEVVDCQVMRDGATGRSRGFGFLTFKDPKTVNTVMVKEHFLDGKLIDPKRAIPREEQERTAKIFVGGVSQECNDQEFNEFFQQFGRVLDATLMMDKDTGRPRGFGFVTFDSEAAVDRTLEQPLAIHGKMIEVKRAQPRGNLRDEEGGGGHGKFSGHRGGRGGGSHVGGGYNDQMQASQSNQNGQPMSQAMMAAYWQKMQMYLMSQMQNLQNMQGGGMGNMAAMQNNPAMMQQMMAQRGMNPQMMQQMQQMQNMNQGGGGFGGMQNASGPSNGGDSGGPGSPMNGTAQPGAFNAQEQLQFEQMKYERQQQARMQQGNFQGGNTWDGMYDDVPPPAGMQGGGGGMGNNMRGGRGGGRGGRGSNNNSPAPGQAPANAPTGPRNAGMPGSNYRGGGRGGRRGFHPYSRGGGAY